MSGPGLGMGLSLCEAASGAAAFGPTTAPGNVLFLIGSKGIGVANGANVPAWTDQSTNAYSLANATGGQQPTFASTGGPNGLPCTVYAGGQGLLVANGVIPARSWTIFVVHKTTSLATDAMSCAIGGMAARNTAGTREMFLISVGDETADAMTSGWEAWTLQDDGVNQSMRVNGVAKTLSLNNLTPTIAGQSAVGARNVPPAGNFPWIGSIERVLAYTPFLSPANVAIVESAIRTATAIW